MLWGKELIMWIGYNLKSNVANYIIIAFLDVRNKLVLIWTLLWTIISYFYWISRLFQYIGGIKKAIITLTRRCVSFRMEQSLGLNGGGGLRFTTNDVINLIFSWFADDLEFVDRKYWPVCRSMIGFDWAGHCWNWNDWTWLVGNCLNRKYWLDIGHCWNLEDWLWLVGHWLNL